jgi:transposase
LRGQTPTIQSKGGYKKLTLSGIIITTPNGLNSNLFLRILTKNMNADRFLKFLKELKVHLKGKKLLLFVDGLAAHRTKTIRTYVNQEKKWLRIERFPSYAPKVNPIEYLWAAMKKKHLGNARASHIGTIAGMVKKAKMKMNDKTLLYGFLKKSGLFS